MVPIGPYMTLRYGPLWSYMVPYGHICSRMVLYGPFSSLWSHMVLHCPVCSNLIKYGPVWFRVVLYGPVVTYGLVWSCMVLYGPS